MSDKPLASVKVEVQKFKTLMKDSIHAHCKMGMYTLKFHSLNHDVEDFDWALSLDLFKSSAFERFTVILSGCTGGRCSCETVLWTRVRELWMLLER